MLLPGTTDAKRTLIVKSVLSSFTHTHAVLNPYCSLFFLPFGVMLLITHYTCIPEISTIIFLNDLFIGILSHTLLDTVVWMLIGINKDAQYLNSHLIKFKSHLFVYLYLDH